MAINKTARMDWQEEEEIERLTECLYGEDRDYLEAFTGILFDYGAPNNTNEFDERLTWLVKENLDWHPTKNDFCKLFPYARYLLAHPQDDPYDMTSMVVQMFHSPTFLTDYAMDDRFAHRIRTIALDTYEEGRERCIKPTDGYRGGIYEILTVLRTQDSLAARDTGCYARALNDEEVRASGMTCDEAMAAFKASKSVEDFLKKGRHSEYVLKTILSSLSSEEALRLSNMERSELCRLVTPYIESIENTFWSDSDYIAYQGLMASLPAQHKDAFQAQFLDELPKAERSPKLCMMSVKQDGLMLQWVPAACKTPEVCQAAIKQNPEAAAYAPTAGIGLERGR